MAGGITVRSSKKKPEMEKRMNKNEVARGKGAPFASDGSGRNKPAPLNDAGVAKGKTAKKAWKNPGSDSPIGKERPTQDGGPRTGQKGKVDFEIHDRPMGKSDWQWTSGKY